MAYLLADPSGSILTDESGDQLLADVPPSVTLANSAFPLQQYDEVVFCRDDGDPLLEIPSEAAYLTYGPIMRAVPNRQLVGGSNRVLNGDLTWFDASRKVIRFGNLALTDGTCEAKWSGADLTDPTVNSFSGQVNGAQSTTTLTPGSFHFRSMGAGRVFLPGDLMLNGSVSMTVLAKSVADGSGNVVIYGAPSNSSGIADGVTYIVYRPFPSTLLAEQNDWLVLPFAANGSTGVRSVLAADINLPFIPGEMTNLYWGIEAYHSAWDFAPHEWHVQVVSADGAATLLDVQPSPEIVMTNNITAAGSTLFPFSFTGAIPLDQRTAGGRVQLQLQTIGAFGTGFFGALYVKRVWIMVGNADRGSPDVTTGPWNGWQLTQDTLVDRSQPGINYQVQVLEDNPDAPFTLGATVQLRDPDNGIAATPAIIMVKRTLPLAGDEDALPELTLDNRDPSFIRRMVETGAF